ncbi:Nicotianamine synthase [Pestalotiopsis sp. NC0098]|nr:Nicotianamine synthase [Pestalotiopsis sp. NC0098]
MSSVVAPIRSLFCSQEGSKSNERSRDLVNRIIAAHDVLVGLDDLSPGPITNKTLGDLVSLCCESHDSATVKKVLASRRIALILPSLRRISSQSECCLETHWSTLIATSVPASSRPAEALALLRSFPYFQNYVELARLELCALRAVEPRAPRRIAFLGSGPLPLTSMCLLRELRGCDADDDDDVDDDGGIDGGHHQHSQPPSPATQNKEPEYDTTTNSSSSSNGSVDAYLKLAPRVVNVDRDAAALAVSQALCQRLGPWSRGMAFQESEARLASGLEGFDVVFLAALVGTSAREKEDVVVAVARRMRSGALMVVRSAHGLRTVLYPEVDLSSDRLREVLQVETVTHPYGKVVNSVIIARVK